MKEREKLKESFKNLTVFVNHSKTSLQLCKKTELAIQARVMLLTYV